MNHSFMRSGMRPAGAALTDVLLNRLKLNAGAIDGGLVTYEANGKQFIAVAAGDNNPTYKVKGDNAILVLGLP
ncbi:MAG: hypothetical protein JWO52_7522 [Gammaproteobacteria bacterium]|nr:hypothetical protein [Gammaproteobacteria bacterium]